MHAAADAGANTMPGQLVEVGGHRLHLHCTGSGGPTVVLEPGAGAMSWDLRLITQAVARGTRVCVHDRAGRGWSEPADTPQDATRIAEDCTRRCTVRTSRDRTWRATPPAACTRSPGRPLPRRGRRHGAGRLHHTSSRVELDP